MGIGLIGIGLIRIADRSLVVMMLLDGALAGSATGGAISHPGGDGMRCIEKKNREQANAR